MDNNTRKQVALIYQNRIKLGHTRLTNEQVAQLHHKLKNKSKVTLFLFDIVLLSIGFLIIAILGA